MPRKLSTKQYIIVILRCFAIIQTKLQYIFFLNFPLKIIKNSINYKNFKGKNSIRKLKAKIEIGNDNYMLVQYKHLNIYYFTHKHNYN